MVASGDVKEFGSYNLAFTIRLLLRPVKVVIFSKTNETVNSGPARASGSSDKKRMGVTLSCN